jgi:hypothetical protein
VNIALWIIQALLALVFIAAGGRKLVLAKDKVAESSHGIAPTPIRLLGAVEVLGALGLILPGLTGIATFLTPIAAVGLAIIMVGAAVLHARHGEIKAIPVSVLIFILAAAVAWLRFGPVPF